MSLNINYAKNKQNHHFSPSPIARKELTFFVFCINKF